MSGGEIVITLDRWARRVRPYGWDTRQIMAVHYKMYRRERSISGLRNGNDRCAKLFFKQAITIMPVRGVGDAAPYK